MNREDIIRIYKEANGWSPEGYEKTVDELERFAALVAAAEREDAERWRFLMNNCWDKDGLEQFHVWHHTWEPHSQTGEPTEWKSRLRGPALERAIDAAIRARGQA
jgi:hypothetical protein